MVWMPSLPPTIYRGKGEGEGAAFPLPPRKGCGQEGGGVHPPQGTSEVPSPFRTLPFLISWRMGLLGLVPLAHIGQGAPHTAHVPPEAGGPTRWTPGTLSVVPVQYRVTPKLSRWPKYHFLYIILYLRTIPKLLVTSGISSGLRTTFGLLHTHISTTLASPNLKCVDPTGSGDM